MPSLIRCLSSTIAGRQNRQTRPTGWRKQQGRSAAAQLGCPQKAQGSCQPPASRGCPQPAPSTPSCQKAPSRSPLHHSAGSPPGQQHPSAQRGVRELQQAPGRRRPAGTGRGEATFPRGAGADQVLALRLAKGTWLHSSTERVHMSLTHQLGMPKLSDISTSCHVS